MPKGPLINDIARNFTTRDSLGIESVATSISGEICPVVNTVTPRAFYWPFMVWIYYDFYKYSGIEEHSVRAFDAYLKRQDYFFVLATLLTPGSDQSNLVGKLQTQSDIYNNRTGKYTYNPAYFKTRYGGMQYYNAGCLSLRLIVDQDPETGSYYALPKLTKDGEKMALAFEKVIKNTQYYKKFRLLDVEVPESVLKEYGKVIHFNLVGFDECKKMLREKLFETKRNSKLTESASYIKYLNEQYSLNDFDRVSCRRLLFDHLTPSNKAVKIPSDMKTISNEWEIVIGRQYFTAGLEMIWKHMLEQLDEPFTKQEWISKAIKSSHFESRINQPLSVLLAASEYDFDNREQMIAAGRSGNDKNAIDNGLKVILSIYNRFHDRDDLGEDRLFFDYGYDSDSIPFNELFEEVDKRKNASVKDFLEFVMNNWLIEQHYWTAYEKMLQGRDGFYFELVNGRYIRRFDFDMDFQGIRLIQLAQVMKDLEVI